MNKNYTFLFVLLGFALLSYVSAGLEAKIGCMDNSLHLQERYDTKAYHYVACDCPCRKYLSDRNKCPQCDHFHDAQQFVIIESQDQQINKNKASAGPFETSTDVYDTLKKLVASYKMSKFSKKPTPAH